MSPSETVGECNIEKSRGNEIISFSYNELWLSRHSDIILDPDLYIMEGRQYPSSDKRCFGFLEDSAPDRWGRMLMNRRERIDAEKESRPVRTLMESDYILGVHDGGRIGGLRFFDPDKKTYLSDRDTLAAPPIEMLRKLEQAALYLEENPDKAAEKWLNNLLEPGSSLGGARPKANVIDEKGDIWIAKFPSKRDEINIGAWEMVAHDLALECGLNVPNARLIRFSEAGDTFLTQRFDRQKDLRVHYASAMTMLGKTDGDSEISSYIDIAEIIEQICKKPEENLKELWRRMIFNICISNTDDHLRNHGFLLKDGSWELSPCFDINPSLDKNHLSLYILHSDNLDLSEAIEAAGYFRLGKNEAERDVSAIKDTVRKNWRKEANKYKISKREQNVLESAFEGDL